MHVTAFESGEPDFPRVQAAAVSGAVPSSRGWRRDVLLVIMLLTSCTPVGEVNKPSARADADETPAADAGVDHAAHGGGGVGGDARSSEGGGSGAEDRGGGAAAKAGAGASDGRRSGGAGASGMTRPGTAAGSGANGATSASGAGASGMTRPGTAAGSGGAAGGGGMTAPGGAAGSGAGAGGAGGMTRPDTDAGSAGSATLHWYCTSIGGSCTCVESEDPTGDACTQPKPTCCFTLVRLGSNACTCWPEDSDECKTQMTDVPDAKRVAHCPP